MFNLDGLKQITEAVALNYLASHIPLDSVQCLNEPIDLYSINAKDAPSDGLGKAKSEIKDATGWPDSILDNVRSEDEVQIYQDANLTVETVDGKDCLVRTDIDYEQIVDGETNLERMKQGKAPVTRDEQLVELHHIGQKTDSPFAELTTLEHRGPGNDMILHDKTRDSEIDRYAFRYERETYWKNRAAIIENAKNG